MGIGTLRCHVLHVTDLEVAQRFWSEVTGISPIPSAFPGRAAYLGQADPWRHEVILWKVDTAKAPEETNRAHVDIWVEDVDVAIDQIVSIGGDVKQAPALYPRPGSYAGEVPLIDWAVMRDPFGNEFCLVSVLTREESAAATEAGERGPGDDDYWRTAAGRARRPWRTAKAANTSEQHTDKEHAHGHAHR